MKAQHLIDINLTQEEKELTASIINRFGSGRHPCANPNGGSFNYFTVSYVQKLLKGKKLRNSKSNLTPEVILQLKSIEEKFGVIVTNPI